MFKKIVYLALLSSFLFFNSGCALIKTAVSAATLYGIYKAIDER